MKITSLFVIPTLLCLYLHAATGFQTKEQFEERNNRLQTQLMRGFRLPNDMVEVDTRADAEVLAENPMNENTDFAMVENLPERQNRMKMRQKGLKKIFGQIQNEKMLNPGRHGKILNNGNNGNMFGQGRIGQMFNNVKNGNHFDQGRDGKMFNTRRGKVFKNKGNNPYRSLNSAGLRDLSAGHT